MKSLKVNKLAGACATALLAGGMLTHVSPAIAANTAAGTQIKNLATVTYQDENGNAYSAQSNEAIITVKQVYSAEISADAAVEAAAGQTVYIQHTLTNNGNGQDRYKLTAADDNTIESSGGINADNIKIYLDANGNGLADAGEQTISEVTLAAGESAEVVVAVIVPSSAAPGAKLGVKLTAEAYEGTAAVVSGSVDDTTSASAGFTADGTDGTNQDLITVSQNAVLNYTKAAVLDNSDPQNPKINYTLTVTNNGNRAATAVAISDVLPKGTAPVGTATASGLLTSNGDTLPVFSAPVSEAEGTIDYNDDGDTADNVDVYTLTATDASIAPGQTISISFSVTYAPNAFNNDADPGSAGDIVRNIGSLSADLDGPGGNPPTTIPSNPTQTVLPQLYTVLADDTNANSGTGNNNGGDDDAAASANDIQYVDVAPAGSAVLFNVVLTNDGSGPDTLELAIDRGTFPAGTTFTFWNADGTAQLTNTNSEDGVDTGMLDSGESVTIMVKAQLPTDASGTNFLATLTTTSAGDPSLTPSSNTAGLKLGSVVAPGVDIADAAAGIVSGNEDDSTSNPLTGTRTNAKAGQVGGTVYLPFYLDNESGASDSYQLTAGDATLGNLPTGWTVEFFAYDTATQKPVGKPLTTTPLLPAGASDVPYVAVVSIPSDPANAVADYTGTGAFDANGDGDGDQPIYITASSAISGASDKMLDMIDVDSMRDITLTPPGSNQIQPAGSVDYAHTMENTGNTQETMELDSDNSQADWNNTIMVDTNNDGTPDKTLAQLATDVATNGGPITITGIDGVTIEITDKDGDGKPEFTLDPGETVALTPTVFAPSDAAPGATDVLEITATAVDGSGADDASPDSPSTAVEDVSTVILGQVRLTKTVARDAAPCDGTPDSAFAVDLSNPDDHIPPGDCAIWEIKAENQGDAPALNVVISDAVPAYTTFFSGSMQYSPDASTALAPITATTGNYDAATGKVTFYVGKGGAGVGPAEDGTDAIAPTGVKGGSMAPAEIVTVRFSTKVD